MVGYHLLKLKIGLTACPDFVDHYKNLLNEVCLFTCLTRAPVVVLAFSLRAFYAITVSHSS